MSGMKMLHFLKEMMEIHSNPPILYYGLIIIIIIVTIIIIIIIIIIIMIIIIMMRIIIIVIIIIIIIILAILVPYNLSQFLIYHHYDFVLYGGGKWTDEGRVFGPCL